MKRFNKKGQAAMEFLMTYGWAILAAVVVIGALGTYFYFNQSGTSTAFVNSPFYAVASQINTNEIVIELQNKGGEDYSDVYVTVDGYGCDTTHISSWGNSESEIITLNCSVGSGDSVQGDLTVIYLRPNSELNLTATGSISGTAN